MAETNMVAIEAEVEAVSDTLKENLKKIVERDGKLEMLDKRTDHLKEEALQFQKTTEQLKTQMWWENRKLNLAIGVALVLVLILVILLSVLYALGYL